MTQHFSVGAEGDVRLPKISQSEGRDFFRANFADRAHVRSLFVFFPTSAGFLFFCARGDPVETPAGRLYRITENLRVT